MFSKMWQFKSVLEYSEGKLIIEKVEVSRMRGAEIIFNG